MLFVLAFVACADLSVATPAPQPPSRAAVAAEVHIESTWSGMGKASPITLTIRRAGADYSDGTRTIDKALVAALVTRLTAPRVTSLSDARFGVTRAQVDPARKKADVRALIDSYYL